MIHTIHPTRCAFTRGQHKPAANVDSATCTLPGCDYEAGTLCAVLNCPARSGRNKTPSGRDEGDSRGVPFSHGRAPAVEYVSFHALESAGVPQGFQVLNHSPSPDGAYLMPQIYVPGWLFAFACGAVLWAVILKALGVL